MNYIVHNPYRILGVLSNSPKKEIVANHSKIKAYAKTGKTISFDNDFVSILGTIQRDVKTVANAYSSLALPKDRIIAGLFWFVQCTQFDDEAIVQLREGNIRGAVELLRKDSTVSACINLAVIHLIEEKWTTALYYYTYLINSKAKREELLSIIADNPEFLKEKDFVDLFTDKLLESFPNVSWIDAIHQNEVNIEDKVYNIKNFFETSNVYENLVSKSGKMLIRQITTALANASAVSKKDAKANLEAAKLLEKETKTAIRSLRLSLGKDNKEYKSYSDKVAIQILDNCIDYYNNETTNPRKARNILPLLRFAMRTAVGKIAKDRCVKNFDQIMKECVRMIPEEIEGEIAYIKKQIDEFNKFNAFSSYSGYLNATIGVCYQKMESIKTKVGSNNIHYINTSSDVVTFAVKVIHKEIESKQKDYTSSNHDDLAYSNLKKALEWGKAIYQTIESFPKNVNCSDYFNRQKTDYFRVYKDFFNNDSDNNNVSEEKKVEICVPDSIEVGKVFTLSYSIEDVLGQCRFIEPPIQYLDIIKGPTESVYSKPCILVHDGEVINGCGPICTEYSYQLKANWAGTFIIPPASFFVKGVVYKSSEAKIKVVESVRPRRQDFFNQDSSSGNASSYKENNRHSKKSSNSANKGDSNISTIIFIVIGLIVLFSFVYSIVNPNISRVDEVPSNSTHIEDSSLIDVKDYDNDIIESDSKNEEEGIGEPDPQYEIVYFKTGDKPYKSFYGNGKYDSDTQNSLFIKNGSYCDAVVFLETLNGKKTRHVYIRKDETFTMTQIPGGIYIIKIIQGNSWNPDKDNGAGAPRGGFMEDVSMSKSEDYDPFDYPDPSTGHYYSYEVTLYKVTNGNMSTEHISSSEMF